MNSTMNTKVTMYIKGACTKDFIEADLCSPACAGAFLFGQPACAHDFIWTLRVRKLADSQSEQVATQLCRKCGALAHGAPVPKLAP